MATAIEAGPSMLEETEDEEVTMRRRKRRRRAAYVALGLGTVYYSLAIAYYTQRGRKACRDNPAPANCTNSCWENWDAVDAVYFATVTMTSVGYGDIKPENAENMAVTLVFLIFGFIIVFPSIAQAMAPVYQGLELLFFRFSDGVVRVFIGKRADGTLVDLDGDGMADYEEPPPAYLYYLKGVSSWLVMWILTQTIFAALYVVMDPGTFSFGTAFYFCIVTATTVGYGDIFVSDTSGHRLFASFHILYSVSSLAALLNTVQVLHSERLIQIRKATLLRRQLDPDLIQSLDKDNNGLDKLEFVVGMLTKLEILHWDDVEPFLAQFDALDVDKSGRLDKSDLLRLVDMQREKVERAAKAKEAARLKALEAQQHRASSTVRPGDGIQAMEEGLSSTASGAASGGAGRSRAEHDEVLDMVHEFTPPDGKSIDDGGGATSEGAAAAGSAAEPTVYGGRGARCRELGLAANPDVDATVLRRKRLIPFVGGGLPMQVLAGVRRPRRPRHLRGKVNPGG